MIALSGDLRDARLQLLVDQLEGGTLTLYTEPQPETGAAITTQTALIALTLPVSITITNHVATLAIVTQSITETGLADWGRITNSDDEFVLDGDCGLVASAALFRLKTTALESGKYLATLSASFSE